MKEKEKEKEEQNKRKNAVLVGDIPNIEQREFGFLFPAREGKLVMQRHLTFRSGNALRAFIEERKPLDCFLSIAYYKNPSARKMDAKGWKGADFYFDLDGSPDEITAVKGEAVVIRYALKDDFDIDSQLIFSGCKGYHVVSMTDDDKVLTMASNARGEIVDYLKEKYKCRFIDGPCSRDVHRFRRLPGTVNSKSGNMCKILTPSSFATVKK
jgi:Eukaryotic-type DNA primase, catalytic (small) subunit